MVKIELFHSVDTLWNLHSAQQFGLGKDCWIWDDLHIFGKLYYQNIFNWFIIIVPHLGHQMYRKLEQVPLAEYEESWMDSARYTGDLWWDTANQLSAVATIVPGICASNKTHSTDF